MRIAGREIGPGAPTYVIAEMSANHGGSFDRAVEIVRAAKRAGADAVKLQTYTPDTMTIDSDLPQFKVGEGSLWSGRTLYDLYKEAHTPWEWQPRLKKVADGEGIHLFSSPFDASAVELLGTLEVPAYKIASFEIVDLGLIREVSRTGRPVIISTGMATREEISEAIREARGAGASDIALLKCTSAYPAPPDEMNLLTIPAMIEEFGVPVGISDHTLGSQVPVAAVALGASLIEKHLTISRSDGGPDAAFSAEPQEFAEMVRSVRLTEQARGQVRYGPTEHERPSMVFRRSLYVVEDVEEGEPFTERNVRCIRPGYGLAPRRLSEILGRRASRPLRRGTPLDQNCVRD